jgi:hypothetical protein
VHSWFQPSVSLKVLERHGDPINSGGSISVTRSMQWIHGLIGLAFVVLALLHVPHPSPYVWVPYAAAACLTFVTLFRGIHLLISRVLAVVTTVLLFYFFAGFFMEVPELKTGWYGRQEAWGAISMLFGAFAMLSILSDFSCRCKAECRERKEQGNNAFFSAPGEPSHGNS